MINPKFAYCFLFGMYIGGYTNFFSKVIISGLVVYMINPTNFNYDNFKPLYDNIYNKTKPYISQVYNIEKESNKPSPQLNILTEI